LRPLPCRRLPWIERRPLGRAYIFARSKLPRKTSTFSCDAIDAGAPDNTRSGSARVHAAKGVPAARTSSPSAADQGNVHHRCLARIKRTRGDSAR
jgi:hypothetical protein